MCNKQLVADQATEAVLAALFARTILPRPEGGGSLAHRINVRRASRMQTKRHEPMSRDATRQFQNLSSVVDPRCVGQTPANADAMICAKSVGMSKQPI
jgi:hypothetical protein